MKHLFILILFVTGFSLQAQTFEDAWRYGGEEPTGTARFTAMSGAFSSLGGDLSAVGLNPAGATTFATNRFTATLSFFNTETESNYFNTSQKADYNSFDDQIIGINQIGAVWVYKSDVSDWNKIAFSVNYNKKIDFGNYIRIKGLNTAGHSVTDYYVNAANGIYLSELQEVDGLDEDYQWLGENYGFAAQQAYLAYQAWVINPVDDTDDDNTQYVANAVFSNVAHQNKVYTSGSKSVIDFAIAGTYKKNLQMGFSISAYSIDYEENNTIIEDNYDAGSDLQYLKAKNALRVDGSGLSLKLGAIYKLGKGMKVSFAYHSPEWLEINEYMKQSMYTEMGNGDVFDLQPEVENEFAPYKIITPSKYILGASAVIDKKGLISVDYTYQNMGDLHFKEKDYDADTSYFDAVNDEISDTMQAVHKLNIGGELKLSELSLRAGGFMTTSPYKADDDLFTTSGMSFGMGYDFGGIVMDFAYMHSKYKSRQYLLNLPDAAKVETDKNKFMIGLRYNF